MFREIIWPYSRGNSWSCYIFKEISGKSHFRSFWRIFFIETNALNTDRELMNSLQLDDGFRKSSEMIWNHINSVLFTVSCYREIERSISELSWPVVAQSVTYLLTEPDVTGSYYTPSYSHEWSQGVEYILWIWIRFPKYIWRLWQRSHDMNMKKIESC